jgi:hypothetical protein
VVEDYRAASNAFPELLVTTLTFSLFKKSRQPPLSDFR